jgi:glycosyltransferase involved in cell wall biosynthesis
MGAIPRVSVVIPTYNSAAYLPETIASVTAQSFQDFEIIIVDDGSTDQTKSLVERSDQRVRYVFQEHAGIPAKARNKALELVRGEFVAFVDSDDLWEAEKLERQVQLMETQVNVAVCFTDHCTFGASEDNRSAFDQARANLDRLQKTQVGDDDYIITSPTLLEDCLMRGPIPFWTSTILVRRSSLESVGRFNDEMPLDDDTQMWLRLAKQCRVGFIDKVLARRRIRPSSISASSKERDSNIFSLKTLDTLHEWLALTSEEREAVKCRAAEIAFAIGYGDFSNEQLKSCRKWLVSSLSRKWSWKATKYIIYSLMPVTAIRLCRTLKRLLGKRPIGIVDAKSI